METILWVFNTLLDKGLVHRCFKVMMIPEVETETVDKGIEKSIEQMKMAIDLGPVEENVAK